MAEANKKIIKIQASIRRVMAMKKIQKTLNSERQKIREQFEKETNESSALREFVLQLNKKKLTAEAFFRICDQSYK